MVYGEDSREMHRSMAESSLSQSVNWKAEQCRFCRRTNMVNQIGGNGKNDWVLSSTYQDANGPHGRKMGENSGKNETESRFLTEHSPRFPDAKNVPLRRWGKHKASVSIRHTGYLAGGGGEGVAAHEGWRGLCVAQPLPLQGQAVTHVA